MPDRQDSTLYDTAMKLWSILLLFSAIPAYAIGSDTETEIKKVLNAQVEAWNRGELEPFVAHYAQDCTFVGKQVVRGRAAVLERYRTNYTSPTAMGKLTFHDLDIRTLDKDIAIVTGKFHLDRTAEAGGPAAGIFSLVMQRRNGTWQIVLDHTS